MQKQQRQFEGRPQCLCWGSVRRSLVYSMIFLILALFGQGACAALIERDWAAAGDRNVLLDAHTGLEWLKLSVTANQSFNDVAENLGPGGVYDGFRFATEVEVLALWAGAGITHIEREWMQSGEHEAMKALVDLLGPTTMFEVGEFPVATHALGMIDAWPESSPDERWVMELTYAPDGLTTRTSARHYTWNVTAADIHYSSYLVREVPLPAAFWLLASGMSLLLLGGGRRGQSGVGC